MPKLQFHAFTSTIEQTPNGWEVKRTSNPVALGVYPSYLQAYLSTFGRKYTLAELAALFPLEAKANIRISLSDCLEDNEAVTLDILRAAWELKYAGCDVDRSVEEIEESIAALNTLLTMLPEDKYLLSFKALTEAKKKFQLLLDSSTIV